MKILKNVIYLGQGEELKQQLVGNLSLASLQNIRIEEFRNYKGIYEHN